MQLAKLGLRKYLLQRKVIHYNNYQNSIYIYIYIYIIIYIYIYIYFFFSKLSVQKESGGGGGDSNPIHTICTSLFAPIIIITVSMTEKDN